MKNLLRMLLSKNSDIIASCLIGWWLVHSYKFLLVYILVGPIATMLSWSLTNTSEEYKKQLAETKETIPLGIRLMINTVVFIYCSLFWVSCLIRHSRSAFFPEEQVS